MVRNKLQILLMGTTLAVLGGCSGQQGYRIAEVSPLEYNTVNANVDPRHPNAKHAVANQGVFHFGFDQAVLSTADKAMVDVYSIKMKQDPSLRLRVSGHTDSIGSREYNIGLGERRALAIKKLLMDKGINGSRISVISYGKEQPLSLGNTPEALAQNRRAVLEYER